MCDFSEKVVAWMDGELELQDAAAVKEHLEVCAECRGNIDAYRRASDELNAYFHETPLSDAREWSQRTVALASATGALAAVLGLVLLWPRIHAQPHEFYVPHTVPDTPAASSADSIRLAQNTMSADIRPVERPIQKAPRGPASIRENEPAQHRHEQLFRPQTDVSAYSLPAEAVVEIAIPADDMFPPGAVPAGMNFVAEMTIAADGSAARLQVRPRLAGFERSTIHP